MFTDADLLAYLDEVAAPDRMAAIEAALRDEAALRERVAALVEGRDAGVHSLGEVWRRSRVTCPPREQLGSWLLEVLPSGLADYISFHLDVVGCRWCAASVEDLRRQAREADAERPQRRGKYFESSVGRLSGG